MPAIAAPNPPLSDGVVSLRPWRPDDAHGLVEIFDDPEIARWTRAPSPYRERDAIEWLIMQRALAARGERLALAIVDAIGGELIGSIDLRIKPEGRGELGYAVAPRQRRRGAGSRALRLFACWALARAGRARLEVYVEPENVGSLRVAERAGFRREGLLRSYGLIRGRRVDLLVLSLLPADVADAPALADERHAVPDRL